ncbi:MAG TPA: SDR family oxidoreductase [Vicinamibacterales bacterium]|nr:SDR family oxidoreductase [Vicinamibacterales bacterium]
MTLPGIDGKRVLVSGATSGIGLETTRLLASLGASVAACGRQLDCLQQVVEEGHAGHVEPIACDFEDPAVAETAVLTAVERLGPLDGLVHSAGIMDLRPLKVTGAADLERIYRINVEAGILLAKAFRKKSARRESASIVFVSSVMGLIGDVALTGYCASKGALIAASRALALELAPENIRVNCVAPGQVRTPMWERSVESRGDAAVAASLARHPLGLGTPVQIAWPIVFLLSDAASWITGVTLPVDGGDSAG